MQKGRVWHEGLGTGIDGARFSRWHNSEHVHWASNAHLNKAAVVHTAADLQAFRWVNVYVPWTSVNHLAQGTRSQTEALAGCRPRLGLLMSGRRWLREAASLQRSCGA